MGQFTSTIPLPHPPDTAVVRPCFQATGCPHTVLGLDRDEADVQMRVHAREVHGTATHLDGAVR